MLTATKSTKIDPIFAAIEAHRRATAVRYPILEKMMATRDGAPERWAMEDAHEKWADIEKKGHGETAENSADDHCRRDGGDGVLRGTHRPLPGLRVDY
jgi:hypothetical protein